MLAQKRQAATESYATGANVAEVARRHGVRPALLRALWLARVANKKR